MRLHEVWAPFLQGCNVGCLETWGCKQLIQTCLPSGRVTESLSQSTGLVMTWVCLLFFIGEVKTTQIVAAPCTPPCSSSSSVTTQPAPRTQLFPPPATPAKPASHPAGVPPEAEPEQPEPSLSKEEEHAAHDVAELEQRPPKKDLLEIDRFTICGNRIDWSEDQMQRTKHSGKTADWSCLSQTVLLLTPQVHAFLGKEEPLRKWARQPCCKEEPLLFVWICVHETDSTLCVEQHQDWGVQTRPIPAHTDPKLWVLSPNVCFPTPAMNNLRPAPTLKPPKPAEVSHLTNAAHISARLNPLTSIQRRVRH